MQVSAQVWVFFGEQPVEEKPQEENLRTQNSKKVRNKLENENEEALGVRVLVEKYVLDMECFTSFSPCFNNANS